MSTLTFTGREFISLDDSSYRWFDLKRFSFPPISDCEASSVIESLISDWHYRDHYTSADSHERDSETLHGPFWVAKIHATDFTRIPASDFVGVIREFCDLYDLPPSPARQGEIDSIVTPFSVPGITYFRLGKPLDSDIHEFGWVLSEFREFVAVDCSRGSLGLLVMAID